MNDKMQCQGFQFELDKEYEEKGEIELCKKGFHACESPLDVLDYYPLVDDNGNLNRFFEVEQSGDIKSDSDKTVSSHIKIKVEIKLPGLIKASIDFLFTKIKKIASGYSSKLAASGDFSQLAASGYSSKLAASGDSSKLAADGKESIAAGIGIHNKCKAKLGWIVLVDWRYAEGEWQVKEIYHAKVGQKIKDTKIEPNVWYWFEDGELKSEAIKIKD
jgi:hypothetical protein